MCEVPKVYLQRRNSSNTENGPIRMPKTPRKPKNSPHRVSLRRKYFFPKSNSIFQKTDFFLNRKFQTETVPFNQKSINLFRRDVEASLVLLQNHQNPNLSMICLQVHQPLRSLIGLQSRPGRSKSDVLLTETSSNIRKTRHFLNFLARNQVKNANENRRCFKVLPL